MSLTRTRQEFVTALMHDMGTLDLLQTPRAEDAKYLKGRYDNIIAELRDEDLVYWNDEEIPTEVFEALIVFMKLMCAPAYGMPGLTVNLDNALENAKLRIRRRTHKMSSSEPVYMDDF